LGNEVLLDTLADSADVATLVGARDRYIWPTNHDLRRITIVNPTLAYPLSLIFPRTNPHPGLRAIINHCGSLTPLPETAWLPSWATTPRAATETSNIRDATEVGSRISPESFFGRASSGCGLRGLWVVSGLVPVCSVCAGPGRRLPVPGRFGAGDAALREHRR
jgi:hypothetical protein